MSRGALFEVAPGPAKLDLVSLWKSGRSRTQAIESRWSYNYLECRNDLLSGLNARQLMSIHLNIVFGIHVNDRRLKTS